ncbi:MAG: class I SAM-dependent methyltransferase [Acidimicrobiia bacterium]|nr:class I SAM-dependent methyltransferase [Acidimicrobiia bacterium]
MSDVPSNTERLSDLAEAYDFDAAERDKRELLWRAELLDGWVRGLADHSSIVELGAGTGQASRYLADKGFNVLAIDLSPANVAKCQERGVSAVVADMGSLQAVTDPEFAPPYDAAFAINSLIHFPKAQLVPTVQSIRNVLRTGAHFMFTLWGGQSSEGIWDEDWTEPKRFFSFYEESEAAEFTYPGFEVKRFSSLDNRDKLNLYSLVVELVAS